MLETTFGYDPTPWEEHRRVVSVIRETIGDTSRYQTGNRSTQKAPYNAPIDIPGLNKIVQIDRDTSTAWVEPNVTTHPALLSLKLLVGRCYYANSERVLCAVL
ncbi:hypothetical protein IQ07DRAFT_312262 [Pyrenochaeta sp. DS3sAY3a]|nr:hypothetical protein IQ07DRAFT_312262 [Pyrenochaeta sp. DS3sAY3a]